MRLAAQAKAGFYPAHEDAIRGILVHLRMPEKKGDEVNILDPCAGEGLAIKQLSEGLGVKPDQVYCIELSPERAAKIRENLPKARVVGPASYMGVRIDPYKLGMVYVNAPYDDEMGGGKREEHSFIERSVLTLARGGILVAVLPYNQIAGRPDICNFLDRHLDNICLYKFPDAVRQYRETVIFGRRRAEDLPSGSEYRFGVLSQMGVRYWSSYTNKTIELLPTLGDLQPKGWLNEKPAGGLKEQLDTWELMPSWKPHTFCKFDYTDDELAADLARSPLNRVLIAPPPIEPARPPMGLGAGHVALLLASGYLNGVVYPQDGSPPHVVRGTARKEDYTSSITTTENVDTGSVTTKQVISQKVVLTVRAVDETGEIRSFTDAVKDAEETEEQEGNDYSDDSRGKAKYTPPPPARDSSMDEHFETLDLDYTANYESVESHYKLLVRAWHPDRFTDGSGAQVYAQSKMARINNAHDLLVAWFERNGHVPPKEPNR